MTKAAATERLVGVATSVLLLLAVSLVGAGPAEAASGRCAAGTGVTVVVDYGSLGGGVAVGCDSDGGGKPASSVVPDAGFPLSWVQEDPGFVCSVAGKPDPSTSCTRTPPSNAYWGLFWSDGDPATWSYASEGARSLDVPEGGSIGWRFQSSSTQGDPGSRPDRAGTRAEAGAPAEAEPETQPEADSDVQPHSEQQPVLEPEQQCLGGGSGAERRARRKGRRDEGGAEEGGRPSRHEGRQGREVDRQGPEARAGRP